MDKTTGICELCCNKFSVCDLEEIVELSREILSVLLIQQTDTNEDKSLMCRYCSSKINLLFEFKCACLYTEDFIAPFVDIQVDLKELFVRKKAHGHLACKRNNWNLCRLCMELVDERCIYLNGSDSRVNFVEKLICRCVPEVDVSNTKNAVVCDACIDSLKDYSNFLDKKIKYDYSTDGTSKMYQTTRIRKSLKMQPPRKTYAGEGSYCRIKTEDCSESEDRQEVIGTKRRRVRKYAAHVKRYECDSCTFKSNRSEVLKNHLLLHKNPSDIEWLKCYSCDYKSKEKSSLKKHMVVHSSIEWFRCDSCDFKSKHIRGLNTHVGMIHKNTQIHTWLNCPLCDCKLKGKRNLTRHMSVHKDPSTIEWFKCQSCDFKSKKKFNLQNHMILHKDPSEIAWFKCDLCNSKLKLKGSLKRHMLIHTDPSEVKWFECYSCGYKSRVKNNLKVHMSIHKHPLQIDWIKCNLCDHKARTKVHFKNHMVTHLDPSEVEWFECYLCDFKSRHERRLNNHIKSVHKKPGEGKDPVINS